MGYYKNLQLELESRGYGQIGKFICPNCVEDADLRQWVEQNPSIENDIECDYCGEITQCIPVENLIEKILRRIEEDYGNPDDVGVYYDDETDSYDTPIYDTEEIVSNYLCESDELMQDIIDTIYCENWCDKNPYRLSEKEQLLYSWEHFANTVKYKNRYLFFVEKSDKHSEYLCPVDILKTINSGCNKFNLIETIPSGTTFYRAQFIGKRDLNKLTDKRLGAPPASKAKGNRMSAEGISVFYGANDEETCIIEVTPDIDDKKGQKFIKNKKLVVAEFENVENIKVLNLCAIDNLIRPGLFANEDESQEKRNLIIFLQTLNKKLSIPIKDLHNIEYVPMQVLAEYFKNIAHIQGIRYNSSKSRKCNCIVLFYDNSQCTQDDTKLRWLKKQKLKLLNYKIIE